MNQLRKQIRKELKRLMEGKTIRKYPATPEIINTLKQIFQGPLVRYVDNLKAVNTLPPSYRVFLKEGGKYFDLYIQKVSIVAKVGAKEYWLMNDDETVLAQQELNRLLTKPVMNISGDEETDDSGGSTGSGGGGGTPGDTGGEGETDSAMETEPEEEEPEEEPTI